MVQQTVRPKRVATPERWREAVRRALDEGVQARQVNATGAWIATSGSDAAVAYELCVFDGVARACSCPAGVNLDPVCKHRAAFYLAVGLLDEDDGAGADRRGMTLVEREEMAAAARARMTPAYAAQREAERERVNAARLRRMAAAGSTVRPAA